MLVLSRKLNEEIVIGGEVRVRVLELRGGRVRLGISAPPEVSVERAEVPPRNDCGGSGIGIHEFRRPDSMPLRAG